MLDLQNPIYSDEDAARAHLESVRWPDGPFCPHCGNADQDRIRRLDGEKHRPGLLSCYECRKQFSVTVGTVFERSHVPLHKWVAANHLMCSSKKGVSAHQLHRMLGVAYKTAWFMAHRIREAMGEPADGSDPMGGKGKIVEADETYLGPAGHVFSNDKGWQMKRGVADKMKVVTLVERGGRARSVKVDRVTSDEVLGIIRANAVRDSVLMTDESPVYDKAGKGMKRHYTVNHAKGEYAKGFVSTNTVEGYFSIFKRGMKGVYQHCTEHHLQRYLNEFDFRYSNRSALGVEDAERAEIALKGIEGKRLTYRGTRRSASAA
jgi:transposase-like protein